MISLFSATGLSGTDATTESANKTAEALSRENIELKDQLHQSQAEVTALKKQTDEMAAQIVEVNTSCTQVPDKLNCLP